LIDDDDVVDVVLIDGDDDVADDDAVLGDDVRASPAVLSM
jgi:hypothetical protein